MPTSHPVAHPKTESAIQTFDVQKYRKDFPILSQQVHGKPLVYLDNAATTQKPLSVIETEDRYYREYNANIHRGVHLLSQQATKAYEDARVTIQKFLNATQSSEIIYTRGATEGINLVAQTWGRKNVQAGDEILISAMEHHSNIVPWQILCEEKGAKLQVIPINDAGELLMDEFKKLVTAKTKLVAVTHVSNALGTINPVAEIVQYAHSKGVLVLIDGAQSIPHVKVDVQSLDCDFYVFSGHKIYAPTGIGVLYGKLKHLEAMPPYQGGGDMIASVTFQKTIYAKPPHKFEAGTPHIAGVIGLGAALDYVSAIGL
ncbi:MAG TPA: aminotransferase class V-fold PLP-dependent enzyme, partial [bacterium]|nr:aminotransferase class V-fold PLP-dependent enzyme [bacterium]